MNVKDFVDIINSDFYTGVPDSLLKPLCDYLMNTYQIDPLHHIVAANEGNCAAIAAGYHLATGKIPVVYLQNSGQGNILNPVASLLNNEVYAIPVIFIIGWRGEPGVHDEPQHVFQGKITERLLEDMAIDYFIIDENTSFEELSGCMSRFRRNLLKGKCVSFLVKKGAFFYEEKVHYRNQYLMSREEIIEHILSVSGEDPVVSTTGKASRELFEIRETLQQGHQYDFLTVGCMGHSSSIALGIALHKPNKKIWCIDGDGAVLMHLGAMAVIGANRPKNMIHIVINNEAHETVGGVPTVSKHIDLAAIAKGCGYTHAVSVDNAEKLDRALYTAKMSDELTFIEVKCAIGSRKNLGRPTTTTFENKQNFMLYLDK